MAVSYSKLWRMQIDRKMSHVELQRAAEVTPFFFCRPVSLF